MVAFDKTGTLTAPGGGAVVEIEGLSVRTRGLVRRLAAEFTHPLSRAIAEGLAVQSAGTAPGGGELPSLGNVCEVPGRGVHGTVDGEVVAIGTPAFIAERTGTSASDDDCIHAVAGSEVGRMRVSVPLRPRMERAAEALAGTFDISLISGDHGSDRSRWVGLFGPAIRFRQSAEDKLALVNGARAAGRRVLMVGDGLNDAGALAAADVGLAVSDDTACLVPACDGLIAGGRLADLPAFLRFARRTRLVVLACFAVSVAYNAVGLTLALSGALTPLASAVLMPVSSISIIALSSGLVRWSAHRMLPA